MRRDEDVPPYRRLHRESDTIKALSLRAKRGNLPEGKTDVPDTLTLQYSPAQAHHRTRLSFRALVKKSPAKEIITIVHVMRRDEGVPLYLRLHRESDTMSFRPER